MSLIPLLGSFTIYNFCPSPHSPSNLGFLEFILFWHFFLNIKYISTLQQGWRFIYIILQFPSGHRRSGLVLLFCPPGCLYRGLKPFLWLLILKKFYIISSAGVLCLPGSSTIASAWARTVVSSPLISPRLAEINPRFGGPTHRAILSTWINL